ncbi:aspartate carbamoyltransferase catalytic subunit [Bacteriovoracaceae bacterium]|nr:aspartate carbamoyltransferase catalytic subunit [Bacteriovoracaceae bacterium]|tara:strand:- start:370196 stop:371182 length:987 start_codon:yes stop_codon:yes gene_type:complete
MVNFPSVLESINDLSLKQTKDLLELASKFKGYANDWQGLPTPFIRTPIIATSFLENSTRTKHSFAIAIKKLGATYIDFNAETSSLKKGESLEETLLTLHAQGTDLCIIRTNVSNQLSEFKDKPPIKIINGGDGINQHPTQALLDLFTMKEIGLSKLQGKTITIVGDIYHSRVGHSLIDLLPQFGINLILCGPQECLPDDLSAEQKAKITLTTNVDEAIEKSDLLYLLRIQKERHEGQEASYYENYPANYGISVERLKKHGKNIPIFHPGPANVGVEISEDLIKSKYYFGHEQVNNSVYMRMAIIQAVLQNQDKNVGIKFNGRTIQDLC